METSQVGSWLEHQGDQLGDEVNRANTAPQWRPPNGVKAKSPKRQMNRKRRKDIQIIFQAPYSSPDPRMRVGEIIEEGMEAFGVGKNRSEHHERVEGIWPERKKDAYSWAGADSFLPLPLDACTL